MLNAVTGNNYQHLVQDTHYGELTPLISHRQKPRCPLEIPWAIGLAAI